MRCKAGLLARREFFEHVTMQLHFDGLDGSTTFSDSSSSSLSITAVGDAQISAAQSKFGGTSGYFDGTGDYLLTEASDAGAFGAGDFTIEFWVYSTNTSLLRIADQTPQISPSWYVYGDSTTVRLGVHGTTAYSYFANSLSSNTWHHVAMCRKSGSMYMFLDGVSQTVLHQSGGVGAADFSAERAIRVGVVGNQLYFPGYIDELRLTKAARYTASFTTQTSPFQTT